MKSKLRKNNHKEAFKTTTEHIGLVVRMSVSGYRG